MQKDRSVRLFLASMTATLYLFVLCAGAAIAEYNTRNVGFGDARPLLAYSRDSSRLQMNIFGGRLKLDLSGTEIEILGLDPLLSIMEDIENFL